jgi:hypothetical protein
VDRRTLGFFALVLVLLAGVGVAASGTTRRVAATRPDTAPTVDGIVVGVDSAGLGNVSAFRLRTDDGRTLQFSLATLEDGVAFPPGHLGEHVANSARVRVWYRDDAGNLAALWLEDAPAT